MRRSDAASSRLAPLCGGGEAAPPRPRCRCRARLLHEAQLHGKLAGVLLLGAQLAHDTLHRVERLGPVISRIGRLSREAPRRLAARRHERRSLRLGGARRLSRLHAHAPRLLVRRDLRSQQLHRLDQDAHVMLAVVAEHATPAQLAHCELQLLVPHLLPRLVLLPCLDLGGGGGRRRRPDSRLRVARRPGG